MILAAHWIWRADGLIHLVKDGHDLPRGPLGLLLYLPFALLFWAVPPRARTSYLTLTSYFLLLATLGPGYALLMLIFSLAGFAAIRIFGRPGKAAIGIVLSACVYAAFIAFPQPPFLPPIRKLPLHEPLYFYLHWAGIGYVFLKTVHVLVDVSQQKMDAPPLREFLTYLLFAPTVKMGPIYRYPDFERQLQRVSLASCQSSVGHRADQPLTTDNGPATTDIRAHPDFGAAAIRIIVGLVRLGIMAGMLKRFPIDKLFDAPSMLPPSRFMGCLYAAPLSIYLWISGYVDISIGMGLLMGFRVPENFNYPWKATSLADFWRRWHLTLGAWLRDYLYIPLGGNRRHVFFNYFVTFLFCGVWHGLYLSYALWGISQGVGLAVNRSWGIYWKRHRDANTPLYQRLAHLRLVSSPINVALCWLLTFHYQILTIVWFMDEEHAGRRMFGHMVDWFAR